MNLARLLPLAACLLIAPLSAFAQDAGLQWPQWRGPRRDGHLAGKPWPATLDRDTFAKQWRVELEGPSFSGPIVAGDRVFVTLTRDEKTEHVIALDRTTGRKLWETSWEGAMEVVPIGASAGSWIRSTPATDGTNLYVLGMRDVLVALDVATGKEQWRLDFVKEYQSPVPDFGGVSSPMLLGDHLFVQAGSGLVKVEKRTGKPVWRVLERGPGKSGNSAFASPYAAKIGGAERIFVQTREELVCVDPVNGDVIWKTRIPSIFGMNIFTPTVYKDAVLTSTIAGTFLVAADPVVKPAADPDAGDGVAKAAGEMLWKNVLQGYMSSPILIGDHAYIHLRNQRVACVNLADGKRTWTSKPLATYLSMVAQGDKILALGDDGVLRLFAANPEVETRLGEVGLLPPGTDDSSWAHLAVAGEQFFVRDLTGVTAYRWTDAAGPGRHE
jgi:outer membrane protein assembly factor BamB